MMRVDHNYLKEMMGAALADIIAIENFEIRELPRCALFGYCLVGLFWRKIDAYFRWLPALARPRALAPAFTYTGAYNNKALLGAVAQASRPCDARRSCYSFNSAFPPSDANFIALFLPSCHFCYHKHINNYWQI